MRYAIGVLLVAAFLIPAWASEPGEPLDCGDWVFLEPGYECVEAIPDCDWCLGGDATKLTSGGLFLGGDGGPSTETDCPGFGSTTLARRGVTVRDAQGNETIIGYVQERCGLPSAPGTVNDDTIDRVVIGDFIFDNVSGSLYFRFDSTCQPMYGANGCTFGSYTHFTRMAQITGFATTFEVLQTYTPTANEVSFRVPYMPEGFQYADYFDTYTGPLTNPIDFSKAQPLECDYPATVPTVGDYLTVTDPLPDPAPGAGRYYVTAVTHQGQTRYGRKNIGGLSGRDPGVLQGCDKAAPIGTTSD